MKIRFNHLAIILFCILMLGILDSCQGMLESSGVIRAVNGGQAPINGKLDSSLPDLERLRGVGKSKEELTEYLLYESDNPLIHVEFLELSGRMWRGTLIVPPNSPTGDFSLVVHQKGVKVETETPRFTVRVFKSRKDLQDDVSTICERFFGFKPLWIVVVGLPLAILMLYLAYKQNDKEELRFQACGIGAIYKLAKRKDHWEVVFGLGEKHGVTTGQELLLLDASLQVAGRIVAMHVDDEAGSTKVPLTDKIKPTFLVARKNWTLPMD